jgi:hypothetical protein
MALRKHRIKDSPPRRPFWKDERILGKRITVSTYLRILIVAAFLIAVSFGYVLFAIINYLSGAHASRIHFQNEITQKVDKNTDAMKLLACAYAREHKDALAKQLRTQYDCAGTVKKPVKRSSSAKPHVKTVSTTGSSSAPTPVSTRIAGGPDRRAVVTHPAPVTSRASSTAPRPTRSTAARSTSHASRPTPSRTSRPAPSHTPQPTPSIRTTAPVLQLPSPNATCQVGVLGICVIG